MEEELRVIRDNLNKLSSKYRKMETEYRKLETENIRLKENISDTELLEKEIIQLNKTIQNKDKEINKLKTRLEKKMKYSKKYKWDDECLYVDICKKRNIKQCEKCNETGVYIGKNKR